MEVETYVWVGRLVVSNSMQNKIPEEVDIVVVGGNGLLWASIWFITRGDGVCNRRAGRMKVMDPLEYR